MSRRRSTSASVEQLNDNQYECLKQLKRNVSDVLPPDLSDVWLIKWLRSNNYNLKKTETVFRATMRLREVYQFDTIVETFVKPKVCAKYEFTTSLGIAKNGSPIRYTRFGTGDLPGFLQAMSGYDICLYCGYMVEYDMDLIRKENQKGGREVHEVTYVVDMQKISLQMLLNKATIETGLDLLQVMQDHYPEIWGNIFIVNAPSYFDRAFNIFKPILKLNLLQKIRVASVDSTPALLLKYIDADVLPAFLGGKRTDSRGDPRCSEFIPAGGIVPEEYYLRNRNAPLLQPTDAGASSVWVSARSVFNYSCVVRIPDSRIHVEFRTENGGVGLKMFYRPFGDDPSHLDLPACDEYLDDSNPGDNVLYVSPSFRMQSHTTPVDQTVRLPWEGIYIFRFDNTHSWFRSKKIIFRFGLIENI